MIEEELYSHLSSEIDYKIYPMVAPADAIMPCLVYTSLLNQDVQALQGDICYSKAKLQLDCYAKSYSQVKALASIVKDALYKFKYYPHSITIIDDYEHDTKLYRQKIDFKINT